MIEYHSKFPVTCLMFHSWNEILFGYPEKVYQLVGKGFRRLSSLFLGVLYWNYLRDSCNSFPHWGFPFSFSHLRNLGDPFQNLRFIWVVRAKFKVFCYFFCNINEFLVFLLLHIVYGNFHRLKVSKDQFKLLLFLSFNIALNRL